jgi:hypothetical protein
MAFALLEHQSRQNDKNQCLCQDILNKVMSQNEFRFFKVFINLEQNW